MPTANQIKASIDEQITNKTLINSIDNNDVGNRMKDIVNLTLPLQFNTTAERVAYLTNLLAQPFQFADDKEDGNKYFINKDGTGWNLLGTNDPKIEIILFENQSSLVVAWTTERKTKFGGNADFIIETEDPDGKYRRKYGLEIFPDDIDNTTSFTIDLGGVNQSGRLTIK